MPRAAKSTAEELDDESGAPEPAWRQRAIDRSTQSARQRAAKRVQRFLNAAREIIEEKGSIEFTVQEVVDRSKQSLRSFYQYFDGKHELLLSLFEEEMDAAVQQVKAASADGSPLERLEKAVVLLFDLCSPTAFNNKAIFVDFAQRLIVTHPDEVAAAYAPQVEYITSLVQAAADAGLTRPGKPRRQAAILLQTATTTASRNVGDRPISGAEVWDFCRHAIVPDDVAARAARS